MNIHIQEAARQILGEVSDIQAELSFTGSNAVNLKLAAIREKAAFLFEGHKGPEKIISGYQAGAQYSLALLADLLQQRSDKGTMMNDTTMIEASHLCEVFLTRCNIYFERKARAMAEESDVN